MSRARPVKNHRQAFVPIDIWSLVSVRSWGLAFGVQNGLLCHRREGGGIKRYCDPSVCLSQGVAALGYSHRRPPEMCGLRTRPRTDVDPPRFLPPSNCHRRGGAYRVDSKENKRVGS